MREERLLARIANLGEDQTKRGRDETSILLDSVINYIQKILNTRQGSVPTDLEFGVPDYSSLSSRFSTEDHGSLAEIEHAIKVAIQKYEPRLSAIKTHFIDKADYDITLTMIVEAQMKSPEGQVPIVLKVVIKPNGNVEVSS